MQENLDRSLFLFSKKQIILPTAGLTEFYSIKLRYPFTEDSQQVTMIIQTQSMDGGQSAAEGQQKQHVYVYP